MYQGAGDKASPLFATGQQSESQVAAIGKAHFIEQFVGGEEITVAVVDGVPMPVVRILPESGFFDFEAYGELDIDRHGCLGTP